MTAPIIAAIGRRRRHVLGSRSRAGSSAPPLTAFPTGPPDFVGVGVQKAGTSWWYTCLCEHPLVFHPPRVPKERHFFADHRLARLPSDELRGRYADRFPRPTGTVTGEWTPRYLFDRWALSLLATAAPDTRILVLLRDPVARLYSGLCHHLDRGRPPTAALVTDAVDRSRYQPQLDVLLATFGTEAVLVQQYEQCVRQPLAELSRAFAHLGLESINAPSLAVRVNAGSSRDRQTVRVAYGVLLPDDHDLEDQLRAGAQQLVDRFDLDAALWPSVG